MSIRFEVVSREMDLPASGSVTFDTDDNLVKCDLHRVCLDGETNYDVTGVPLTQNGVAATFTPTLASAVSDAVATFPGGGFKSLTFANNTATVGKIIVYSYSGL